MTCKIYNCIFRESFCILKFLFLHVYQEFAESLIGKDYGKIYPKVCDVTDEQAVKNVFSWVDSTLGGLSILINNAGVAKLTSLLSKCKI